MEADGCVFCLTNTSIAGNMSKALKRLQFAPLRPPGAALALTALVLLGGCVAQVRVPPPPPPPPPRGYVPPPPAYVAPVVDVEVQASEPPPPLPSYEQPACPEEGYLWTPGYWGYAPGGYYWVPGTWVRPPRVGLLWTPGYWGFVGGVYAFNAGYWGPHVGFYGGVNYGFGYVGVGFAGGRWVGNSFAYNQSVTNVNVTVIHNTYNQTVVRNTRISKVSYNGGAGGTAAAPTSPERTAAREPHVLPTLMQRQHVQEAGKNPALFAKANGGRPAIAATPRPAAFNAPGVVRAHGAATRPPHPAAAFQHRTNTGPGAAGGQPNPVRASAPNVATHPQASGVNPNTANPKALKPHPSAYPEKGKREPEGGQPQ